MFLRYFQILRFHALFSYFQCVKLPARVTVDETTELYIKHKTGLLDNVR